MKLVPFADTHLDQAANLLAQRDRVNSEAAYKPLEAHYREPGALGFVALKGERCSGFLLGNTQRDDIRGRSAWVRLAGHAVDGDPDIYRDLYAALSEQWVRDGYFAHYVMLPAMNRAALDVWYSLGFGQEQVHAIRELVPGGAPAPGPLAIRQATPADLPAILEVADLIAKHQAQAPVFAPVPPETFADYRAGWAEVLADATCTTFLALEGGLVIGLLLLSEGESSLHVPERSIMLDVASIRKEYRGQGIGQALTAHAMAWAQAQGYGHCATDWRATNLLSSRFWPRQGFRPVVYRLARQIDPRIAWAK
jgi:GNAT superfamily N-acetyltransferase